jgi:serine/threonine-protein kinase
MKCARCDHEIPAGDRFCGRCGLSFSEDGQSVDPLVGLTLAGRYCIERRIGVGGMGTVYLAAHTGLGQKVAVKVLHERFAREPQLKQRFENEARTYGKLNHPNLVSLHDFGSTPDGTLFMVMEYCPGTVLSVLLRERKALSAPLAVDVAMQIAQALTAAHTKGFVHRDLKPDNVMLMESRPGKYHAKLLDFGIAKNLEDEVQRLTQAGMVFGTPEYMSPEQARGEDVDGRTDIYALGTILYELLLGKPPFTGSNKFNVMHRQASEVPARPSTVAVSGFVPVPEAVEAVVMKCLEKRAEDRFQSAHALIEALERSIGLQPADAPPLPVMPDAPNKTPTIHNGQLSNRYTPPPRAQSMPRHTTALAVLGGVAAVGLMGLFIFGRSAPETETPGAVAAGLPSRPIEPSRPALPSLQPAEPVSSTPAVIASAPAAQPVQPRSAAPRGPSAAQRAELAAAAAKERAKALSEARKALRQGNLDAADIGATRLVKAKPDDQDAKAVRDQARNAAEALRAGRSAFERGDCPSAVKKLAVVLNVSPEHRDAKLIVAECNDSLPPTKL